MKSIVRPKQSPAAHFVFASVCVPTDDDAAARLTDLVAPSKAARSSENDFPPTASESSPHLAGHVSACGARLLESWLDDRPGIPCPALPGGSQTTASIPWLRSPHAPAVEAWNKTPARCGLRVSESCSPPLQWRRLDVPHV